jgi:proline-rich protein PRCC
MSKLLSSTSGIPLPSTSTISSAPVITEFKPPEPSMTDPYPGYYQLPSGSWAAHDPEYYESFRKKWEKEYNDHLRALEKGAVKGFEGADGANMESVDAAKEMEKAKMEVKEREERKAISKTSQDAPAKPKMNITVS